MEHITLFGFHFISADSVTNVSDSVLDDLLATNEPRFRFLITPNAYQLVHFKEAKNKQLEEFYSNASYVLPDGMPIVWLSKLMKRRKIKHRLTGSDLFPVIWTKVKKLQINAAFILPTQELCNAFSQEYNRCTCLAPGCFETYNTDYITTFVGKVADAMITGKASVVFIGLGFPKQEILGMRLSQVLEEKGYKQPVAFLLLGASFEFYYGLKKRAPALLQRTGLEWLYRFMSEPKRLWKRYTIDNIRFLGIVIKEIFSSSNPSLHSSSPDPSLRGSTCPGESGKQS